MTAIQNGFYKASEGGYTPSHILDSDALYMNGRLTPRPGYNGIGDRNVGYFKDPVYGVPGDLHNEIIYNTALNNVYSNIAQGSMKYATPNVLNTYVGDNSNPYAGFVPNTAGGQTVTIPNGSGLSIPSVGGTTIGGIAGSGSINPFDPNSYAGGGALSPNGGSAASSGNSGILHAPADDDYAGQLSARLSLIEKYCEKYGKVVDVDELRAEFSSNPEEGVEKCDEILNGFDQGKLEKLVKKEYKAYTKSYLDAGKAISDKWVETALKNGLPTPEFGDQGVTKNNVLDVVGTFMTNPEVKNGKVSLENIFEEPEVAAQLVEAIKARADETLRYPNLDEGVKDRIVTHIATLRDNYDKYQDSVSDDNKKNDVEFNKVRKALVQGYEQLFAVLRRDQATRNDEAAKGYYGLPKDTQIKLDVQTERVNEEFEAHKNRKKLSTSI